MAFFDAIFAHDVEDAVPDGIPIPSTPGEPRHSQPGEESALGVLARACL